MSTDLTLNQALALAADPTVVKAAQALAQPQRWRTLGYHEQSVWGECQGSAAAPYETQADLSGPAVKCSCPSHKQPCKHGLALLLLFATQLPAFTAALPPSWVSAWLAGRAERAQKQETRRAQQATPRADPQAQAKRSRQRQARILAGLDELDLWLQDLARRGLASLQGQTHDPWEALAARMVDAQAPGLARQLREIAALPVAGSDWSGRLMERLGRLYLVMEGYRRLEQLPPGTQADLRALVGWNVSQEALAAEPGVRDEWLVMSQHVSQEDPLRVRRTWLWGRASARPALLLEFAVGAQVFETHLLAGQQHTAELAFYPSAHPLRAALRGTLGGRRRPAEPWAGYPDLAASASAFSAALTRQPWLDRFPVPLQAVQPQRLGEQWWLRDAAGLGWPLPADFAWAWELLALSGGQPLPVFGEWNGHELRPLSAWAAGRVVSFNKDEA